MNQFFSDHPDLTGVLIFILALLTGIGSSLLTKIWVDWRRASTPAYKSRVSMKPVQPIVVNYRVKLGTTGQSSVRFDVTTESSQTAVGDDQGVQKVAGVKTGDFVTVSGPNGATFKVEVTTGVSALTPTTTSFDVPAVADSSVGANDVLDPVAGEARMVGGAYVTEVVVKMHGNRGSFTILES